MIAWKNVERRCTTQMLKKPAHSLPPLYLHHEILCDDRSGHVFVVGSFEILDPARIFVLRFGEVMVSAMLFTVDPVEL